MASERPTNPNLTNSTLSFPSTTSTESYSLPRPGEEHEDEQTSRFPSPSPSPPSTFSSPLILYKPPTLWGLVRGAAINILLPFVNGLMLGFGELVANEAAFRLGWSGTKIFPISRSESGTRRVGPGVEMRADPVERRRRNGREMDAYTSLE